MDLVSHLPGEREEEVAPVGRKNFDSNWLKKISSFVHLTYVFICKFAAPKHNKRSVFSLKKSQVRYNMLSFISSNQIDLVSKLIFSLNLLVKWAQHRIGTWYCINSLLSVISENVENFYLITVKLLSP